MNPHSDPPVDEPILSFNGLAEPSPPPRALKRKRISIAKSPRIFFFDPHDPPSKHPTSFSSKHVSFVLPPNIVPFDTESPVSALHPFPQSQHPPKLRLASRRDVSNLQIYDPPDLSFYSTPSLPPHPSHFSSVSAVSRTGKRLKPVSRSVISYKQMMVVAAARCPERAPGYNDLINLISSENSFSELFLSNPFSASSFLAGRSSSSLRDVDISDLLSWDIIIPKPRSLNLPVFNKGFTVPKSDRRYLRFILDCTPINSCTKPPPTFHLPSPWDLITKALRYNVCFVADFLSWFFQHGIPVDVAKFFAFRVRTSPYLLLRLAQGWKGSPVIAQKSSEIIAAASDDPHLEKTEVWIDDLLFLDESEQHLTRRREVFLSVCNKVNAIIGDISPISSMGEYVGTQFDLHRKAWRVKPAWLEKAKTFLQHVLMHPTLTATKLWATMGLILWYTRMSLLPIALLDPLINQTARLAADLLGGKKKWTDEVALWSDCRELVHQFIHEFSLQPWRVLNFVPPAFPPSALLFTDASTHGGAAVADGIIIWQTLWDFPCDHRDILYLETLAWSAGVFQMLRSGTKSFISVVDSEALFYSIIKTRCDQFRVSTIICKTLLTAASHGCVLRVGWVCSDLNIADAASRGIKSVISTAPSIDAIRLSEVAPAVARYAPESPGVFRINE